MGAFNIPLQIQNPDFETPSQVQQRVLGVEQAKGNLLAQQQDLKMAAQQEQLNALRIKESETAMQEAEIARMEQEEVSRLFRESKGNLGELYKAASTNARIRPDTALKIQQADLEHRSAVLKMTAEETAAAQRNHEEAGRAIRAILNTDPVKRGAVLTSELKRGMDEGWLTPEQAQQYASVDVNNDGQLEMLELGLRSAETVLREKKVRDQEAAAKEKADAEAIQAARDDAARSYALNVIAGDEASLKAWRDELPEKVGGKDFRRNYPMTFAAVGGAENYGNRVGRMARTQAQQDAYEKSQQPARESNPTEASLARDAAGGNKEAAEALRLLRQQDAAKRAPVEPKEDTTTQKRIDSLQKKVDDLQAKKDSIAARNTELGDLSTEIGEELTELYAVDEDERDVKRIQKLEDQQRKVNAEIVKNKEQFKSLSEQQQRSQDEKNKLYGGGSPASGSPRKEKKPASMADVRAYATKKGITEAAARKEFENAGYEVK